MVVARRSLNPPPARGLILAHYGRAIQGPQLHTWLGIRARLRGYLPRRLHQLCHPSARIGLQLTSVQNGPRKRGDYSWRGGRRSAFLRPWCFLLSSRARFFAAGSLDGRRLFGTRFKASSRSANRPKAFVRFCTLERRSVATMTIPVGGCHKRIPVSRRLRCCPPGPPARTNSTVQIRSSSSMSVLYRGRRGGSGFFVSSVK